MYAPLDLSVPAIARRTRLYRLDPIGVGTPMVESLTGYLIRLAAAHAVSPGALILRELANFLPDRHSDKKTAPRCAYSTFVYDAYTLNSTTASAERWVSAVEAVTGREDLRFLTMLPWKHAFSSQGLVRAKRAWCPRCYEEWRDAGDPVYEPLQWMIAAIPICFTHREPLTEICPHCRSKPYVISCRSLPGHCSRCGRWLGSGRQRASDGTVDVNRADLLAESAKALLLKTPALGQSLSAKPLRTNLQNCVDDLCERNRSVLRRTAGINDKTIEDWIKGRILPAFDSLLQVCLQLGIPVVRLVTEILGCGDPDWERAREVASRHKVPAHPRRSAAVPAAIHEARRNHAATGIQSCHRPRVRPGRMEQALKKALLQDPPPTLRDVSLTLGLSRASSLSSRFPALCRALVERSKEHRRQRRFQIEEVLRAALVEDPPPAVHQVVARIGLRNGSTLWRWFPDLHRVLAARAERRHEWSWHAKRLLLEQVVIEEPPPSGRSVAERIGTDSGYLRTLFPALWREIVARHAEYRQREAAKHRAEFAEEARRIARELLKAGQYPSRKRVRSLIRDSRLDGAHLIVREVKQVLREFQGRNL